MSNKQPLEKFRLFLMLLALACGILSFYPLPKAKAAAVDPSNLVSDSVFEDDASMSAPQIDAFLDTYASSCISQNHFSTPDPLGYSSTSNSYTFGGNVTAGQAIYDIAQNYHINPQVILTTLQKEQSVVTGGAGCYATTPNAANAVSSPCGTARSPCTTACPYGGGCLPIAMSYSCPNDCYAGIEGFSNQISGGTWLLRFAEERAYGNLTGYAGYDQGDDSYNYSGPMTPGYRQRVAGGPSIYYDGTWTTNDGTSVTITNGATASLYTYTPFLSGNQNFVNLFQNTFAFGSTISGNCTGAEPPLPYVERYYNPRTFDHFYTAYACDQNFLTNLGYILEGPVFNTTVSTNPFATPVYRYYNPSTGQHLWSTDSNTADLVGTGYQPEAGIVFYVDSPSDPNATPVYRFYNPNTYLHFWASSVGLTVNDLGTVSRAGYSLEGPVFYTQ